MTRDEVLLIKCWDSAGADFLDSEGDGGGPAARSVPATFSLHTAFNDPTTPPAAPERVSLEVRTVAFFDEPDTAKL